MFCDIEYWWPLCESNTVPTDSGLCSFHYSLDFVFTIAEALGGCRQVSTRSTSISGSLLRSALPCASLPSGFTEFDTIPYTVSTYMAHLHMSPLL